MLKISSWLIENLTRVKVLLEIRHNAPGKGQIGTDLGESYILNQRIWILFMLEWFAVEGL